MGDGDPGTDAGQTADAVLRRHAEAVLRWHGGNKTRAAAELGVSVKTVYNWLNRWAEDDDRRRREGDTPCH